MTQPTFKNGDHPRIASMWHPTLNQKPLSEVTSGSSTKSWFICDQGHPFESTPKTMTQGTGKCQYCSGRKVLAGFNDLKTLDSFLAAEWADSNELRPDEVMPGSNKMATWIGQECGHTWDARIMSRAKAGAGCPFCSGQRVLKGFNDAATHYPHLIQDYADTNEKPLDAYTSSSNARVDWECHSCGNKWSSTINNRTNHSAGCPQCGAGRAGRGA